MGRVGKNISCNNTSGRRRIADSYETPYSLTELLLEKEKDNFIGKSVCEPACGNGAIVSVLRNFGISCEYYDIDSGKDFLKI